MTKCEGDNWFCGEVVNYTGNDSEIPQNGILRFCGDNIFNASPTSVAA